MTDRGVSVTVSYALGLAVATILLSALVMTTGGMIETRQQEVYRNELRVVGNDVSADITAVDRLTAAGADKAELNVSTPASVGGSSYEIRIEATGGDVELVLQTHEPTVIVNVPVENTTDVETGTVSGGPIRIHADAGGPIEVQPR